MVTSVGLGFRVYGKIYIHMYIYIYILLYYHVFLFFLLMVLQLQPIPDQVDLGKTVARNCETAENWRFAYTPGSELLGWFFWYSLHQS